jgi:hypothetical protein
MIGVMSRSVVGGGFESLATARGEDGKTVPMLGGVDDRPRAGGAAGTEVGGGGGTALGTAPSFALGFTPWRCAPIAALRCGGGGVGSGFRSGAAGNGSGLVAGTGLPAGFASTARVESG